jgi:restriction endonuclease Mrr
VQELTGRTRKEKKMAPFTRESFLKSMTVCCVSSAGRRKKRWDTKEEAAAIAVRISGKYYRCMFHRDTYHVTSKCSEKPTQPAERHEVEDPEKKLNKINNRLERAERTLIEIHEQVRELSDEELREISLELYARMHYQQNTVRQLLTELEYIEGLLDEITA